MKKVSTFLFSLLFFALSHSQKENFKITWNGSKKFKTSSSQIELPHFQEENFNFSASKGLRYTALLKNINFKNSQQISIINIKSQNISKSELKDLKLSLIPSEIKYTVEESIVRNKKHITVEGDLKYFESTGTAGSHVRRGFCPECGSGVLSYAKEISHILYFDLSILRVHPHHKI